MPSAKDSIQRVVNALGRLEENHAWKKVEQIGYSPDTKIFCNLAVTINDLDNLAEIDTLFEELYMAIKKISGIPTSLMISKENDDDFI